MWEAATICLRTLQVDLSFDLESGIQVTCDVGYLCVNFSLPRPLCSRLRPDVRDRQIRQTDVRCASSLNAPAMGAGITINVHNITHQPNNINPAITYGINFKLICNRIQPYYELLTAILLSLHVNVHVDLFST